MTAPIWATALLRAVAPPDHADDVIGDLNEVHGRRIRRRGRFLANALTTLDALDMAVTLFRLRTRPRCLVSRWAGTGGTIELMKGQKVS